MSDLTDFLLARIAEDEIEARATFDEAWEAKPLDGIVHAAGNAHEWVARAQGNGHADDRARHIARHDPARVLAECEAKRSIVEVCARQIAAADERHPEQIERSFNAGAAFVAHNTLLALTAVYADHPDYRDEWRP